MNRLLHTSAKSVIRSTFVSAALEDYLIARWAAQHGFLHQFLWSGAQSIEKLLKARLLLNRISIKKLSHDLLEASEEIRLYLEPNFLQKHLNSIPKENSHENITIPDDLSSSWHILDAISIFQENGAPQIRYRSSRYTSAFFAYIHVLDSLAFALLECGVASKSARTVGSGMSDLARSGSKELIRSRLPDLAMKVAGKEGLEKIITYQNLAFFPELFEENKGMISGFSMQASAWTSHRYNADHFNDEHAKEDLDWLLNNSKISYFERGKLEDELRRLKRATKYSSS